MSEAQEVRGLNMNNSEDYKSYLAMCNSEEYQLLQKFYHRKTLFDILGVARQENPHSSFLSWLLDPFDTHGMGDFPLKRFLETACLGFSEYGTSYLTDENKSFCDYDEAKQDAARKKLLFFCEKRERNERDGLIKKLKQADYRVLSCQVVREKMLDKQRRADIYMELLLETESGEQSRLLIFIENKVKSAENDQQTDAYMDFMLTKVGGGFDFILPVFLAPVEDSELLDNAKKMADPNTRRENLPCVNRLFLLLNYQHLMDGVLSPCRTAFRGEKIYDVLTEYVSCLGKSIDDSADAAENAPVAVMAVSAEEKAWSSRLWKEHQDVLNAAGRELRGETEAPFLLRNGSDTQFYRTVLSSVIACREDLGIEPDQLDLLQNAVRVNQRSGFYVRQSDSSLWNFISGKRGKETLGALAYALLKQYILDHPDEKAADIRDKLVAQIHHSWLGEILVTKNRLKELTDAWLGQYLKSGSPVCPWDQKINKAWAGCPLYELKKEIGKGQDAALLRQHGCPVSSKANQGLYDWYFREKKSAVCACLYYFVSGFYVRGLPATFRDRPWQKNGVDAALIFNEDAIQNDGANDTFGPIPVGKDDFVYVARWWGVSTVEKLIDTLDMGSYANRDSTKVQKSLDFMMEDL
jgi:hypothetical protein